MLRPGGVALLAGPLRRTHPLARALSDAWMLFPAEDEYVAWFERAGFERSSACTSPPIGGTRAGTATAWRSRRQAARRRAAARPRAGGARRGGARAALPARLARFAAGSLAGAAFIPVALWFTLVRKLRR